jgi:hypothetical protein
MYLPIGKDSNHTVHVNVSTSIIRAEAGSGGRLTKEYGIGESKVDIHVCNGGVQQ